MKDKRYKLLGEEKIEKSLLKMAIPAIIGMVVNAIYNIVDTMFVGWLGTSQMGAITVFFSIFMIIGAIGLTFGIGAGSYISRLMGANDIDKANRTASTAFASTIAIGTLCTILGLVYLEPLLITFGATETILPYAVDYGRILVAFSVVNMLTMTMNNMLRAEGSAKISMVALCVGAVLNLVLDPIFIFGLNLGIKGAAIATAISQIVSAIVLLQYYLSHKSYAKLNIKFITLSKEIYYEIMKVGIPNFGAQFLTSLAMAFMNNVAIPYGDVAIAAIGIINRVFMLAYFILFGYNQGFQPVAGFSYGAKKYDRLKSSINLSLKWTTIYCAILTILFVIFSRPICKIFISDKKVIDIASRGLRLYSLTLPFAGIMVIFNGLFQALGKGFQATILSISRQGIFLIPALIVLPNNLGLNGVLLSQPVADICTLIVTVILGKKLIKSINHITANSIANQAL